MTDPAPLWFFGTPAFAARILRELLTGPRPVSLVLCQPDRPRGRGRRVQPCAVKHLARNEECSLFQPETLRDEEARQYLGSLAAIERPAAAIVASYGQILPPWLLGLPTRGFVNVHASLLPRWRGASPIEHAIWAGDAETGVTLMEVAKKLDAGPLYCARRVPIDPDSDAPMLENRLAEAGAALLRESLETILAGTLRAEPQDEALVTCAPRLEKSAGVLDWRRPARELERQVRALRPWPGTFTGVRGRALKVLRASPTSGDAGPSAVEPGTIVSVEGELLVRCGQGLLGLDEVQLEGKRPQPAAVFLRGFPLKPGERLEAAPQPNPAPGG